MSSRKRLTASPDASDIACAPGAPRTLCSMLRRSSVSIVCMNTVNNIMPLKDATFRASGTQAMSARSVHRS